MEACRRARRWSQPSGLVTALMLGLLWTAGAGAQTKAAAPAPVAAHSSVDPEYILGPGDVVAVDVWHEPEISRTLPIRPDGRLSLPLVGEIQAQGKTAQQLQSEIATRLKKFIDTPTVTVMVTDAESQRFVILGQVLKPGTYPLTHPSTILDAIAMAGGLQPFAHGNKIYLLRKRKSDGVEMRYNFNYKAVSLGVALQENVALQPGDVIVVP